MALFQKKIEPRCVYCARSRPLDEEQVVCDKKGVMSAYPTAGPFDTIPSSASLPAPPRRISAP